MPISKLKELPKYDINKIKSNIKQKHWLTGEAAINLRIDNLINNL